MKCPYCGHLKDKVVDSRESREGQVIRRRRECLSEACGRRFTTYEQVELAPIMVIKKDGRRERFDRAKLLEGLLKACEKRAVPLQQLEAICDEVEGMAHDLPDREIPNTTIGEHVVERLRQLDDVAYVRFASVYRQFKDINEFMAELKDLLDESGQ
ncbi:MAG TPA: transcriptional regulator NrdR [Acidobacteriota bacterium]|jgi:transcriptional repressor NrdR